MDKEVLEFLQGFKSEVNQQFNKIDKRFNNIEGQLSEFNLKFNNIDSKFNNIESQLSENTQILKALEHSAQVNKAEHDKMFNHIAHMSENIECIKKDLSQVELVTANNWADIAKLKAVK